MNEHATGEATRSEPSSTDAMLDLRVPTPRAWLDAVFADFDAFLVDHAGCEKKAFSTGMALVSRYPEESGLVAQLIDFCKEELEHFGLVHELIRRRGLRLAPDVKDPYANALFERIKKPGETTLVDRLLISGIIEARSCERLYLLARALPEVEPELAPLYLELARAESRHHGFFFRLARRYGGEREARARAGELLDFEAELVQRLPHRAAVH